MYLKHYILIVAISITSAVKNYDGYKVYKVVIKTEDDLNIVRDVQSKNIGEFWDDQFDVSHVVKIMVAPETQEQLLAALKAADVEVTEIIGDMQRLINDQMKPADSRSTQSFFSLNWNQYHSLEEIYAWMDELAAAFPNIIQLASAGTSFENRIIKGIIINYHPERNTTLVGMLEGTIHAREWIAAASVTWIIKEFLTSTDPEIRALAENIEWHIFPVTNPDGYVYTFTHNRMWRKNRSTFSFKTCSDGLDNDMSNGVDLNRNFDFKWMTVGASDDACSNTYGGPSAGSEPETKGISEYALTLHKSRGKLIYYFAFHSYTQLIIVPYSHLNSSADDGRPSNYGDMYEIAQRGRQAIIDSSGATYRVGVSAEVMYPMSGTSFDWVKYNTDVPVCYLFELRDLGEFGFLLNREQIIPTAMEIMDALLEIDKTTREIGYYRVGAYNSGGKAVSVAGFIRPCVVATIASVLVLLLQLILYKEQ